MPFSANAIAVAALLSASSLVTSAHAQDLTMPSDKDIKAQMERHRKAAADAMGARVAPAPRGTFKAEVPVVKAPPPAKRQSLDDVLQQYADAKAGKTKKPAGASDLIIFVSFSMPKEVLAELSRQAKAAGAVMVIRGFKNGSLQATKQAALEVNKGMVPWEIHPELFKAFQVKSVPTFVVASAEAESVLDNGCAPDSTFAAVTGNISVDVALDTIRRRAQPSISKLAATRIESIRNANEPGHLQ